MGAPTTLDDVSALFDRVKDLTFTVLEKALAGAGLSLRDELVVNAEHHRTLWSDTWSASELVNTYGISVLRSENPTFGRTQHFASSIVRCEVVTTTRWTSNLARTEP